MSNPLFRFATVRGQAIEWSLKRNLALTSASTLRLLLWLCLISATVGALLWSVGFGQLVPYALLQLLVVGLALGLYARHAADAERLYLQGERLVVEHRHAGRLIRAEFRRSRVRVEPSAGDPSLIEVSEPGRSVAVGRYLPVHDRAALAREIRMALRGQ